MSKPIKLTTLLNEMAMKPTLEREFEKIVRQLQGEYEEHVKQQFLSAIERASPVFEKANEESVAKRDSHYVFAKTFGTSGPYSDRRSGYAHFFRRWVFLNKEYAATIEPKFKKEIDTVYNKWQTADTAGSNNADDLWWAWKMELAKYVMMPKSYWKKGLDDEAKRAAEMFYTSFINKNVAKFSDVIKGKDITEIKHNLTPRTLSGNLIVKCSDGSGFRASFSVETSVSVNGKWFNRFPTRFHDVVMSDGTKMASPSEAKMKQTF